MKSRQRLISQSFGGAADETRGAQEGVARVTQTLKADDIVIRIDRPLPPPEFVCDATCETILGIDRAVYRRVAKRLPHRREHGTIVVARELIVAELRRVEPPPAAKPKSAGKKYTAAELIAQAGWQRVS